MPLSVQKVLCRKMEQENGVKLSPDLDKIATSSPTQGSDHGIAHPFSHLMENLEGFDDKIYNIQKLGKEKVSRLPYCIRVLLESAVRNCDGFLVTKTDVENILSWDPSANYLKASIDVPFIPARVILQDFTGVPCVVDLAAMRDAMVEMGCDPLKINPKVPVDLVIDHSIQVDKARRCVGFARLCVNFRVLVTLTVEPVDAEVGRPIVVCHRLSACCASARMQQPTTRRWRCTATRSVLPSSNGQQIRFREC